VAAGAVFEAEIHAATGELQRRASPESRLVATSAT